MLYLDSKLIHIQEARKQHYKFIHFVVHKKVLGSCARSISPISNPPRINRVNGISERLKRFLLNEKNLKQIISGYPTDLEPLKNLFIDEKEYLQKIFNYDLWSNGDSGIYKYYNAYNLSNKLKVNTCVYCNRLYTKTVYDLKSDGTINKITRPEFDHWYPRSKYPLLALSFFNLIPSCHVCNSNIKGDDDVSLSTHLHPYVDQEEFKNIKFSYEYKGGLSKHEFSIKTSTKRAKDTIDAFRLKDVYETHVDELNDMVTIRDKYSEKYLESLRGILKDSLSKQDMYRLAFGTYDKEEDYHKRPLSKMKKDILTELGIVT